MSLISARCDRVNVDTDPPFDRRRGDKPALEEDEVAAVAAFLNTVTDAGLAR